MRLHEYCCFQRELPRLSILPKGTHLLYLSAFCCFVVLHQAAGPVTKSVSDTAEYAAVLLTLISIASIRLATISHVCEQIGS